MKSGVLTGMVLAIVLVLYLSIGQVGGFVTGLVESSAQAEIARGQAAALVEQAAAQGDLMRAQAAITLKAADAVDADRRAAHGIDPALAALAAFAVTAVVGAIAFLVWQLRTTKAQLRAVTRAHAEDDARVAESCAQSGANAAQSAATSAQFADGLRNLAEKEQP